MKATFILPVIMLFGVIISGCATPRATFLPAKVSKLFVRKVSVSRKLFNPEEGESTEIKFQVTIPSDIRINIQDPYGRQVKTISKENVPADRFISVIWDGTDSKGGYVESEAYTYIIEAMDRSGNIAIHNPSARGDIKPRKFLFDKETGAISYLLPRAGRVRIRYGFKEGPLMGTLIDWEPRIAGERTESWDVTDAIGPIRILGNPHLYTTMNVIPLKDNTIITEGTEKLLPPSFSSVQFKVHIPTQDHGKHPRATCREPDITVEVPDALNKVDNVIHAKGKVPIKIALSAKDKPWVLNNRFEVMLFLDGVFLYEDEDATDPFTYIWNTRGVPEGLHLITVNLQEYEDHIGSKSIQIYVEKDE